jgi:hypothetical protein
MKILKLAILVLTLLLSSTAYGATELGEFCFSGSFFKEGNCNISLELTQHTKYYSINGIVDCDIQTNTFIGSLIIPHEFGQIGVPFSEIATHSMTFQVNLSNLTAIVRKKTSSTEVCGPVFLPICIEEAVFTLTECP